LVAGYIFLADVFILIYIVCVAALQSEGDNLGGHYPQNCRLLCCMFANMTEFVGRFGIVHETSDYIYCAILLSRFLLSLYHVVRFS